jgi:hypothetical protein
MAVAWCIAADISFLSLTHRVRHSPLSFIVEHKRTSKDTPSLHNDLLRCTVRPQDIRPTPQAVLHQEANAIVVQYCTILYKSASVPNRA